MADITSLFYILPFFIALFAHEGRALTIAGGITGILVAYLILFTRGPEWFIVMFLFFIMASIATRFKEKRKDRMGVLQKVRGPNNVLANGGVAVLGALMGNPYVFLGSLAASFADTVSSEIGVLSRGRPVMITTLRRARAGENGAVSMLGNTAALAGALLVAALGLLVIQDLSTLWIITLSGFAGMLFDSLLGALFENKGHIGNDTVNFSASLFGGLTAVALSAFIQGMPISFDLVWIGSLALP